MVAADAPDSGEVTGRPIHELAVMIRTGEVSPLEMVREYLRRIDLMNPRVNAYITVDPEGAIDTARKQEEAVAEGKPLGRLAGVPVALKDNFDYAGLPTTAGSAAMRGNMPTADSAVASRLRAEGAVVLGKLHLHEWAIGATSVNPHFGPARNPWDVSRSPGGSSGGAGVAVIGDLAAAAIGSDTGGSVRIPAAMCGVSGLRPTFGRVSTRGLHPVSWSHDAPGPLARSAEDVALVLEAIAGYDPVDPTSAMRPSEQFLTQPVSGIRQLRVGLLQGMFESDAQREVYALAREACDRLSDLGARVSETVLSGAEEAVEHSSWITHAEAAAAHRDRLAAQPSHYGGDVKRRLRYGLQITGAQYALARQGGRSWRRELAQALEGFDVLVTPTCPVVAPRIDGSDGVETTRLLTRFTYPFSLANVPAMSIPCGLSSEGLPVGLQLVSGHWQERRLVDVACAYQEVTRWHVARPSGLMP